MNEPRSYTELRADLMRLADEENRTRLALVDIQTQKSVVIASLVEAADKLAMRAFDEHDAHGEYKPKTNVEQVAEFMRPGRKCSNCGEAGHTVRTCTNERKEKIITYGDKVKGTSRLVTEPLKQVRIRKPMSPERRAKAVESLKKARAAKKRVKK